MADFPKNIILYLDSTTSAESSQALIRKDDLFLLLERDRNYEVANRTGGKVKSILHDGMLGFFGGLLEKNTWGEPLETASECLIRELSEETTIDLMKPRKYGIEDIIYVGDIVCPAVKENEYIAQSKCHTFEITVSDTDLLSSSIKLREGRAFHWINLENIRRIPSKVTFPRNYDIQVIAPHCKEVIQAFSKARNL